MKTLNAKKHELASQVRQIDILSNVKKIGISTFAGKMAAAGFPQLKPTNIEILQINVGKMCNQVCAHCHVDAGPDRKEIMTRSTMQLCLDILSSTNINTVDITGGAPEMNPNFRWFVKKLRELEKNIIVRCNLTIIVANKKYYDLPTFFKENKIQIVSSLPYFNAKRTDAQRGDGVFDKSIQVLKMLNKVGYGQEKSNLKLDLVYNPAGAFLPSDQNILQVQFKEKLLQYGIVFNELLAITNLPISRFLDYLLKSEQYEEYMTDLVAAFNPQALKGVMCRNTVSVGWDGGLYDCDFNQMLGYKLKHKNHIAEFDISSLQNRKIIVNQHCYGCTAGAGSSCGGAIT